MIIYNNNNIDNNDDNLHMKVRDYTILVSNKKKLYANG